MIIIYLRINYSKKKKIYNKEKILFMSLLLVIIFYQPKECGITHSIYVSYFNEVDFIEMIQYSEELSYRLSIIPFQVHFF